MDIQAVDYTPTETAPEFADAVIETFNAGQHLAFTTAADERTKNLNKIRRAAKYHNLRTRVVEETPDETGETVTLIVRLSEKVTATSAE